MSLKCSLFHKHKSTVFIFFTVYASQCHLHALNPAFNVEMQVTRLIIKMGII